MPGVGDPPQKDQSSSTSYAWYDPRAYAPASVDLGFTAYERGNAMTLLMAQRAAGANIDDNIKSVSDYSKKITEMERKLPSSDRATQIGTVVGYNAVNIIIGFGSLAGGPAGLIAGTAATSANVAYNTYGATVYDTMQKAGVDFSKPEQVKAALADKQLMDAANDAGLKEAAKYGAVTIAAGGAAAGVGKVAAVQAFSKVAQAGVNSGGNGAINSASYALSTGDVSAAGLATSFVTGAAIAAVPGGGVSSQTVRTGISMDARSEKFAENLHARETSCFSKSGLVAENPLGPAFGLAANLDSAKQPDPSITPQVVVSKDKNATFAPV